MLEVYIVSTRIAIYSYGSLAAFLHPEYPAGHGCAMGAVAEVLHQFFGSGEVAFEWQSTVTGTTRRYATTDAFLSEVVAARIHGGMHFRSSVEAGAQLGRDTARWVAAERFQRK